MNQQQWYYLAETARPQPPQEGINRNLRRSSCLCLSQTHKHYPASCTSKPSSVSITPLSPIYNPQTSRVLHMPCLIMGLTSTGTFNQPESEEAARNCSSPPEVFWCISLYGVPTNAAQLHICCYRRILHHMSFHMLALAVHPFTCIHFRETLLHAFARKNPLNYPAMALLYSFAHMCYSVLSGYPFLHSSLLSKIPLEI